MGFCDAAVEDVLAREPVSAQEAEDGGYVFDYGDLRIYTPDTTFTADSRVTGVELLGENADDYIWVRNDFVPNPRTIRTVSGWYFYLVQRYQLALGSHRQIFY